MTITALNSLTMDAEPTQAAHHTEEDQTQSLHAWSQADDGEAITEYIPRRSWKLPATVAAVAACAAIAAGAFLARPHTPAPTPPTAAPTAAAPLPTQEAPTPAPTIAASPPVKPMSLDDRFIALLKQRNVIVVSPLLAINGGHKTCAYLAQGHSAREIAEAETRATPGANLNTENTFVATAQEIYCPPTG
jgi:hypothetical protein